MATLGRLDFARSTAWNVKFAGGAIKDRRARVPILHGSTVAPTSAADYDPSALIARLASLSDESMPPSTTTTERLQISRAEWLWLAGAVVLGAILRLSFPGRMAIEHFDEGVYASNFWFDQDQGGEYPARYLYAPPLLPMAIEWTMIIASLCGFRPTGFIPMIPCLIAGIATIPSMWWIGRRWFGPTAGIVSAWLVAASDFHSSYSRAALTDVPVCLFILWGVYFLWQAMLIGTRRDLILASLFTGLAWWTKYNGWLPLAIGLAGGAAWQMSLPRVQRQFSVWKRWLLVAGLSFLLWSPVLVGIQKHGGYKSVAENHRQYVGGFGGWNTAAIRQLAIVGLYDNWLGVPYEAWLASLKQEIENKVASMYVPGPGPAQSIDMLDEDQLNRDNESASSNGMIWSIESAVLNHALLPRTLVLATPLLLLMVSILGCAMWTRYSRSSTTAAAGWFLIAWICGLCLATPFYHPYPRLVLPWLIAVWLGVGVATEILIRSETAGGRIWKSHWFVGCVVGWLVVGTLTRCQIGTAHAWQDRSRHSRAIESLAGQIKNKTALAGFAENEAFVYVFGDPAAVFTLRASGLPLSGPIQNLDFLAHAQPRPTFLIRSVRGGSSDATKADWKSHEKELERIVTLSLPLSHLVFLDDQDDFTKLNTKLRSGFEWNTPVYRVR